MKKIWMLSLIFYSQMNIYSQQVFEFQILATEEEIPIRDHWPIYKINESLIYSIHNGIVRLYEVNGIFKHDFLVRDSETFYGICGNTKIFYNKQKDLECVP